MNWPVSPGRYKVGNKDSPIAICTMASVDLVFPMDDIAIAGKAVTENVGVEKIVKNIVSNPNIRFLICCGKPSKGHFVDNALECLVKNGIDKEKAIIGAKGSIPSVKNVSEKEIEQFRKQVEIIQMSGEENIEKIMEKAKELLKRSPGAFNGAVEADKINTITAGYDKDKEFTADKTPDKAWFVIHVDKGQIIVERYVGHGKDSKHDCNIVGKSAEQILGTLVKRKLISGLYHAGYIGKELKKAEIAMKENKEYEQEK